MKLKLANKSALTGLLAAVASSACCIPPLIALVAGIGGGASAFSWIEPARPFLIAFAILAIGYAWYSYFKKNKNKKSYCMGKPKFYQTKGYLIAITLFAVLSIGYPYYSYLFATNTKTTAISNKEHINTVQLKVKGMTCIGCETTINTNLMKLKGVLSSQASYKKELTTIRYDSTTVTLSAIKKNIANSGYIVE